MVFAKLSVLEKMPWTFLKDVADDFVREKENWKEYFLVAGFSCPADWKYPFQCPEGLNINSNKTGACCYNNGPSCCEPGGRRCSDNGSSVRDYCPRPQDNKKLKHCCMIKGNPSCCESSGVYHEARWDDKMRDRNCRLFFITGCENERFCCDFRWLAFLISEKRNARVVTRDLFRDRLEEMFI